jgi:hypothetical protein
MPYSSSGDDVSEQDLALQMTALREQMIAMAQNLEAIKTSVSQIVNLDRTIAELSIHRDALQKDIAVLWKRVDEDRENGREADEKLAEKVGGVRTDLDKHVNTITGGSRVAAWVFTAVQAGIMAAGLWVFSTVSQTSTELKIISQRLYQLEQQSKEREKK